VARSADAWATYGDDCNCRRYGFMARAADPARRRRCHGDQQHRWPNLSTRILVACADSDVGS
jgi:hypothetical protein